MPSIQFFTALKYGRKIKAFDRNAMLYELCSVITIGGVNDKRYYDSITGYYRSRLIDKQDIVRENKKVQTQGLEGAQGFAVLSDLAARYVR